MQDRASSIIYGMPRAALAAAGADRVVAPRLVGLPSPSFSLHAGLSLDTGRASSFVRPVREDHLEPPPSSRRVEQHRAW